MMKKISLCFLILLSGSSFAVYCDIKIQPQEKPNFKILDIDPIEWERDLAEATLDLLEKLYDRGFNIITENNVNTRFTVTDYFKGCTMVKNNCVMAYGSITIFDKARNQGFTYYEKDKGIWPFEASKDRAFENALNRIPNCGTK